MKNSGLFISALALLLFACKTKNNDAPVTATNYSGSLVGVVIKKTEINDLDTIKKSIQSYAQNKIGSAKIIIQYHSPAVRNRIIWGGLVPFDQVWVTGAHSATTIESDKDFYIADSKIPAGKYAIFTIPGMEEWILIINKNWNQHLADDYNQQDDIVRVKLKPETISYVQERLMYEIGSTAENKGNLSITWERLRLTTTLNIPE